MDDLIRDPRPDPDADISDYRRFAVYFAPRPGTALGRFGIRWLGRDAETGLTGEPPSRFVEAPRRYGFHATLKAPMRLEETIEPGSFFDAVEWFAERHPPVPVGLLKPSRIGRFLALVPAAGRLEAVDRLAWDSVTELDGFRAALTEADIARRPVLSAGLAENLHAWGYPYVGEAFRFHMTLTGALAEDDMQAAEAAIAAALGDALDDPVEIEAVSVFGDPGEGRPFRLLRRYPLSG